MNAPLIPPEFEIPAHPVAVMPEEPVVPLTVEGYHALIKAGYFLDGDPYELLEGFVVPKMTKGARHESARRRLRRLLEKLISAEYFVDEQGAMTTSDSEPEPDVFVIRGDLDDFADRHAGPDEVALVAEIADSTLTSALSQLDFRVKRLEFTAGVFDFHLPVDAALSGVDVGGPGNQFGLELFQRAEPLP